MNSKFGQAEKNKNEYFSFIKTDSLITIFWNLKHGKSNKKLKN